MLMFVEYIARPHGVPLDLFHTHARQDWPASEDIVVANLARMNKLGPKPHYMCWWGIASLARVDEWQAYYTSEAGRTHLAQSGDAKVLAAGTLDEQREAFLVRIGPLADEAAADGITVCLETHGGLLATGAISADFVRRIGKSQRRHQL